MTDSYTILYISRAADQLNEIDILELLENSEYRNNKKGLNGILLYGEGSFLQVLEGEESLVKETFAKIEKDKRHDTLIVLFEEKAKEMVFRNYNSKFNLVIDKFDWLNLNEYLKRKRRMGLESEMEELLRPFLESRNFEN
ncbi:BLUF domain-containing protein [Nonlabens marinus]|uniref:BLUF domain-containing protein n=1 Tax=Nonlabens marinus S1-08 TaxID=1454201 RepID=W8VNV6_9FLAO|nr:BLUF domain-containing protein [Nonlabens marinus]BAO54105.1 hypothetical protein NMS_0096 [Nonlabens marinus S1-08]